MRSLFFNTLILAVAAFCLPIASASAQSPTPRFTSGKPGLRYEYRYQVWRKLKIDSVIRVHYKESFLDSWHISRTFYSIEAANAYLTDLFGWDFDGPRVYDYKYVFEPVEWELHSTYTTLDAAIRAAGWLELAGVGGFPGSETKIVTIIVGKDSSLPQDVLIDVPVEPEAWLPVDPVMLELYLDEVIDVFPPLPAEESALLKPAGR